MLLVIVILENGLMGVSDLSFSKLVIRRKIMKIKMNDFFIFTFVCFPPDRLS